MPSVFPSKLRPFSEMWRVATASRTGGQSLSGTQQYSTSPGGRWSAKLSFHLMDFNRAQVEMRGFIAGLDGQFGTFMVGPFDDRDQPWCVEPVSGTILTPKAAYDLSRRNPAYASNPETDGVLDFVLDQPAALNSTLLVIRRRKGGLLRRGQYLQLGDRLHSIVEVTSSDVTGYSGLPTTPAVVTVRVRPWLRYDYPAGTVVNFRRPQCLMRLADPDQGGVEMQTSPMSDLTLSLQEAF